MKSTSGVPESLYTGRLEEGIEIILCPSMYPAVTESS